MTTVDIGSAAAEHRAELEVHCYRMLGSVQDAEDAVQETLVRAWRAADRLEPGSNVRAWLYKIATNRCLTLIERRGRRELPVDLSPGAVVEDVRWLEPWSGGPGAAPGPEATYDANESVRLAFIALLQQLPGRQRAALVLRDVLGFTAVDAAGVLEMTVPALNSALQRARATVKGTEPPYAPSDEAARVADLYAKAWEAGDVDAILALLDVDADYSMPPLPQWFHGRDAIRGFLVEGPLAVRWKFVATTANEQTAFGTYAWDLERGAFSATALDLVVIRGGLITEVVSFLTPEVFARFGLPDVVADDR